VLLIVKGEIGRSIACVADELIHMMRKRQARFAFNPNPSLAEQFDMLAA
jgi:putative transposase